MTSLERSLIATITWFDMFDYPLTAWEAWKWRVDLGTGDDKTIARTGESYLDVLQALKNLAEEGKLKQKWSFFFLPGREEIVETRRKRYLIARDKFRRARWVTRVLRSLPWVRMVSVCNTLGYSNAAQGSDIDFFIITAPGRVWTVRGMALIFLHLFRLRPLLVRFGALRDEKKDRVDLTFFVDETALDLSGLVLQEEVQSSKFKVQDFSTQESFSLQPSAFSSISDPYLSNWIVQQTPLWDRGGYYKKFWDANAHLRTSLPNAVPYITSSLRVIKGADWPQYLLQVFFSWIPERWWKAIETRKMPTRIKESTGGIGVVLGDRVLKFHDIDPRRKLRERWLEKLEALSSQS